MAIDQSVWDLLQKCHNNLSGQTMAGLFAVDSQRAQRFSLQVDGLFVDFSRHRVDEAAMAALRRLATAAGLESARQALATGGVVNVTEHRSAGHIGLRARDRANTLAQLAPIAESLEQRQWLGATGQAIECLVNIGIGGSDLGPRLVVDALPHHRSGRVRVRFLANLDGESIDAMLAGLDAGTTAFCVTSKSFSTEETRINALSARDWLQQQLGCEQVGQHFVAVTGRPDRASEFGLTADRILPLDDEIGGRFSLWSCVGLPIAAAIGLSAFEELLDGAAAMDQHFFETPFETNLPVTLALLGIWYRNIEACGSHAVVPYDRRLRLLVPFLQQLDMESCGKRVGRDGEPLTRSSGAVCWGGEGTKVQHAFFQWLHQSTDTVPVDLIAVETPDHDHPDHHRRVLANLVGQATALMRGRDRAATEKALIAEGRDEQTAHQLAPHCQFPGDQPSTITLLDRLSPRTLGNLLALHEHRVFAQGWIWGINPFDQWGVELGKGLAAEFERALRGETLDTELDAAALQLLQRLRQD
jgi:glucose-6-phosphate isomerase